MPRCLPIFTNGISKNSFPTQVDMLHTHQPAQPPCSSAFTRVLITQLSSWTAGSSSTNTHNEMDEAGERGTQLYKPDTSNFCSFLICFIILSINKKDVA